MEVETRPQPGEGAAASLVIALSLAHFLLQPAREQGANGGAFFGSENASSLEEISFNFQGDIRFWGFHDRTYFRVALFYVLHAGNSSMVGWGWCVFTESVSGIGFTSSVPLRSLMSEPAKLSCPSRIAVSAVISRSPFRICVMRLAGTSIFRANAGALIDKDSSSCCRCSPGCIASKAMCPLPSGHQLSRHPRGRVSPWPR